MPNTSSSQDAQLLVFPNIDSANIALEMAKSVTNGLHIGTLLLGAALPVHIVPSSVSVREIIDMVALVMASNNSNSSKEKM